MTVAPTLPMHRARRRRGCDALRHFARHAWAAPNTVVGLLAGAMMVLGGGQVHVVAGAIEFSGGAFVTVMGTLPASARFGAITLGHVILGVSPDVLAAVRAHEHVHVRQYERWGPLFLPAYLGASLWALAHGRRGYGDNPFEREAYAAQAGPGRIEAHARPVAGARP